MAANAPTRDRRPAAWRRSTAAMLATVALAAALVGACTTREVEDFLYAGGKIAYDSMKARQHGQ